MKEFMIMNFIEKYEKLIIVLIFILGIIIYGIIASQMTSTLYCMVDEELYLDMAKSFFFEGNFSRFYEILNYKCVLYSMIISTAYFFYSPDNILFIMRMIGVILMCSSVFPIYLLSKEILKNTRISLGIALVSLVIPDFMSSLYIIQEVLCYPVFLWGAYFVYLKFTKEKNQKINLIVILLLAIIFFVKSYAISFAIAYFLTSFLIILKNKDYKEIKSLIVQGFIWLFFIAIGIFLVYAINNFQSGTNHYAGQINSIFPITEIEIKAFIYGIFYYTILFLFCIGFIPVFIPIFKIKFYEENDRKYILFLVMSTIITIIETAIIVFIPEEKEKIYPSKICFRYFAPLVVPYILMMLKCKKENAKIDNKMIIAYIISFAYLIFYYVGQGTNVTVIDSFTLFVFQRIGKHYSENYNIVLIIVMTIATTCIIFLSKTNRIKDLREVFMKIFTIGLLIILPPNCCLSLQLSNKVYNGIVMKSEFVSLANFIKRNYDIVYVIDDNTANRFFYGYFISDYKFINIYEKLRSKDKINIDISNQKVAIIMLNKVDITIDGASRVDIGTKYINVYVSDKEYDNLEIKKLSKS